MSQEARGGEMFEEECHPDQCQCTHCRNHHQRQQEAQVLTHFEFEIDRLEKEVKRSIMFYSTAPRHIDMECLMEQQSYDYTKHHVEGSPTRTTQSTGYTGRRQSSRFHDRNGSSLRHLNQSEVSDENLNSRHDVDANFNTGSRSRYDYGHQADNQQLHTGRGWCVEGGGDDPCRNTALHQPDNHHCNPTHRHTRNSSQPCLCKIQQNGYYNGDPQDFIVNNEKVYNDSVRVKKNKRKFTVRIKDTIRR